MGFLNLLVAVEAGLFIILDGLLTCGFVLMALELALLLTAKTLMEETFAATTFLADFFRSCAIGIGL